MVPSVLMIAAALVPVPGDNQAGELSKHSFLRSDYSFSRDGSSTATRCFPARERGPSGAWQTNGRYRAVANFLEGLSSNRTVFREGKGGGNLLEFLFPYSNFPVPWENGKASRGIAGAGPRG